MRHAALSNMRAAKNCGRRAVLLTWWIRGPDLTVTLNGLLGHRWELGVEFLSVHHAKPRGKGVFALGLALASRDTRFGATTPALHAAWLRAWCSMDGNLRYGFFLMGCIKVQSNDHAYGTCLCDDPRLLFKWDRFCAPRGVGHRAIINHCNSSRTCAFGGLARDDRRHVAVVAAWHTRRSRRAHTARAWVRENEQPSPAK